MISSAYIIATAEIIASVDRECVEGAAQRNRVVLKPVLATKQKDSGENVSEAAK